MLEQVIPKLQKELELEAPIGGDGEGAYTLLLDETKITISESSPGFQLTATLGELPQDQQELFFSNMLRGNLFFQATKGSILGLDDTGRFMTLRYIHPNKCEYKEFRYALEDFINTIDFWKAEVRRHNENPLSP
jgi:hypothetical protein